MKVMVINTIDELEALKERWNALSVSISENTDAFSGWEFSTAYIRFFKPVDWIVIVFFPGDFSQPPVAVFPLRLFNVTVNSKTFCVCQPLGMRFCTYTELQIMAEYRETVLRILLDFLYRHHRIDVFMAGQLHEDSNSFRKLHEMLPPQKVMVLSKPALPYIDARDGEFKAFCAGKKKSTLPDVRRCERRLIELGKLEFRTASGAEDLSGPVRELCRFGENKFGEQHVYRTEKGWTDFFVELANHYVVSGFVEFYSLCLDGRMISAALVLSYKGRKNLLLAAYDSEFKKYSPSKVLFAKLIEKTFDEKEVICFGPGEFQYKKDWCQAIAEVKVPWIFMNDCARAELETYINWNNLHSWYR